MGLRSRWRRIRAAAAAAARRVAEAARLRKIRDAIEAAARKAAETAKRIAKEAQRLADKLQEETKRAELRAKRATNKLSKELQKTGTAISQELEDAVAELARGLEKLADKVIIENIEKVLGLATKSVDELVAALNTLLAIVPKKLHKHIFEILKKIIETAAKNGVFAVEDLLKLIQRIK